MGASGAATKEVLVERVRSFLYGAGGQTTSEYVLVLLVAAIVVGVFAAFVKGGGLDGTFKDVVDGLVDRIGKK